MNQKKHKVVLIPLNKNCKFNDLTSLNGKIMLLKAAQGSTPAQQLLILSDEAIVEGDWVYTKEGDTWRRCIGFDRDGDVEADDGYYHSRYSTKKVIAAHTAIDKLPSLEVADIQRWIDAGCPDEIVLEEIATYSYERESGYDEDDSPTGSMLKLTGNIITCVWEEEEEEGVMGLYDAVARYRKAHNEQSVSQLQDEKRNKTTSKQTRQAAKDYNYLTVHQNINRLEAFEAGANWKEKETIEYDEWKLKNNVTTFSNGNGINNKFWIYLGEKYTSKGLYEQYKQSQDEQG